MTEFRSLKENELEQWFMHCMMVFNNGVYSESYLQYFKNHWQFDPDRNLESILVAVEDGLILSTVRIFHRKVYFNGKAVTMGGIGEVSTKPEYRGKGLSLTLLNMAVERMKELNMNLSVLFTGRDKYAFYAKAGYVPTNRVYKKITVQAVNQPLQIKPLNLAADLETVKMIYQSYSKRLQGTVDRDNDAYWQNWVSCELGKGLKSYLIKSNKGETVSYLFVNEKDGIGRVSEYGSLIHGAAYFRQVLESLLYHQSVQTMEFIYPAQIDESGNEAYTDNGMLVRLIIPFQQITENEMLSNESCYTFWDIDHF